MTWLLALLGLALVGGGIAWFRPDWYARLFAFVAGRAWAWVKARLGPLILGGIAPSEKSIADLKKATKEGEDLLQPGKQGHGPRGGGRNG